MVKELLGSVTNILNRPEGHWTEKARIKGME